MGERETRIGKLACVFRLNRIQINELYCKHTASDFVAEIVKENRHIFLSKCRNSFECGLQFPLHYLHQYLKVSMVACFQERTQITSVSR